MAQAVPGNVASRSHPVLIDDVNQAVQYTMDLIGIFAFALTR
ncbi:hypothetical protein [Streptomyces coelicoflavus]